MFKDKYEYFVFKIVQCIIFDSENDYLKDYNIYDISIMLSLKNVVKYYVENSFLDKQSKDNIYNYLLDARDIKDEYYEQRVEIINDIINIVNSQKYDDSTFFYREQLVRRKDDKKIWFTISDSQVISEKKI